MPEIPQFAIPPRVVNGQFATVEQGDLEDLASRVNVLCRTPPGWLDSKRGFGLADQKFRRGGADVSYVGGQVQAWVPDVAAGVVEDPSLLDAGLDFLGLQIAQR